MTKKIDPKLQKKRGRPRTEYGADVLAAMQRYKGDSTATDICRHLGISSHLYYKWMREEAGFSEAVTRAQEQVNDTVVSSLLKRANGYDYVQRTVRYETGSGREGEPIDKTVEIETPQHMPPDTGAAMNWLKNRRPKDWRETQTIKVEGDHVRLVEAALEKLGIEAPE